MDPFTKLLLLVTYSTMFIFRQIDRANFAVRGPCSLMHCLRPKNFINQLTTADPIATPAAVDAMLAIRLGC